jgi:ABC-type sugar transport system permease subunit
MLNRRSRMTHIYRAIIFLPVVISAIATGVIWVLMLDPIIGIVNPVLADIGLESLQREWQADQAWAMKTSTSSSSGSGTAWRSCSSSRGSERARGPPPRRARRRRARWQVFRDITFPDAGAPAFTIVTALSFILIYRAFDLI